MSRPRIYIEQRNGSCCMIADDGAGRSFGVTYWHFARVGVSMGMLYAAMAAFINAR